MTYEPPEYLDDEVNDFYDHHFDNGSYNDPYDGESKIISDSKIKRVYRCPVYAAKGEFFGYNKVPKGFMAAESLFFQQTRKRMHDVNDPDIGRLSDEISVRAGPDLTYIEDMNSQELQAYLPQHSPEHFGRVVAARWGWFARNGEYAGSSIAWNNAAAKRRSAEFMGLAAYNYYNFILENGAAAMGFINSNFPFEFDGEWYSVKFPEIRGPRDKGIRAGKNQWYIDDPSIQFFTSQLPLDSSGNKLENSPIVTMKILGFCNLVHNYPWLGIRFGIPRDVSEKWGGNPIWVDERVKYRHLNCYDNILKITQRSDADLQHFKDIVSGYKKFLKSTNPSPNNKYCGACPINVVTNNGEFACDKRDKNASTYVPAHYFIKKSQEIVVEDVTHYKDGRPLPLGPGKNQVLRMFVNNGEHWRKEVGQYQLYIEDIGPKIIVKSTYHRTLIGAGLEEKLLNALDNHLQDIADTENKSLVHMIDTKKDFSGSGVMAIRKQLLILAYEDDGVIFNKLYEPGIKKRNRPKKPKKEKPQEPGEQIEMEL